MKTYAKIALAAVLFGGGLWAGSTMITTADAAQQNTQPGSVNDPIVTKSYVDQSVQKLVNDQVSKIEADLKSSGIGGSAKLSIVQLNPGETLYAGEGAEFIVRNGTTIAFSKDGNGIPDLTAGKDIKNGQIVEDNHLLMFPRQGRGIKPSSKTKGTIYVMVRGSFLHMDKNGTKLNS